MPLDSTALASLLQTKLHAAYATPPTDAATAQAGLCTAIAEAVIEHFTANAEVAIAIDATVDATMQATLLSTAPGSPITGVAQAVQNLTAGIA
ncbi:MAG: hypothetical protein K0U36_04935 [Alphaproteobacteria bacterium]|nr:hypothetical protein [Alphaproteobacteria bacterium]